MNQIRHSGANSATPGLREHQLGGTSLDLAATLTSSSPILPLTLARVTSQNRSIPGQGQCKERQSLLCPFFCPLHLPDSSSGMHLERGSGVGMGNCRLAISLRHSSQSGPRAEATVLRPLWQMRSCKGHSDFWADGVCLQNQIHEGSALKCMRVCMHAHVGVHVFVCMCTCVGVYVPA